jgi:hypothetical protein
MSDVALLVDQFTRMYDYAVVPTDAVPHIDLAELRALWQWQEVADLTGLRVLRAEALEPNYTACAQHALQAFALANARTHPLFLPYAWDATDGPFSSLQGFLEYDGQQKLEHYARTRRRMTEQDPPRSWFPSEAHRRVAMRQRQLLCTHPDHQGDRLLPPNEVYRRSGRLCRACHGVRVFESVDAWVAHTAARPCTKPRKGDFANAAHFAAAAAVYQERLRAHREERSRR